MNFKDFKKLQKKLNSNIVYKNIIRANINLENLSIENKIELIYNLFLSNCNIKSLGYVIFSWEDDSKIEKTISLSNNKFNLSKLSSYRNGSKPGIFFLKNCEFNDLFLRTLLICHFNFEKGLKPSLNIKVHIYIICNNCQILLEIYDDRGLNFCYLPSKKIKI